MPIGVCPDCEGEVQVNSDAALNDTTFCEDCDARLEIVGLDPLEFEVEDLVDEDYDEDDEEY